MEAVQQYVAEQSIEELVLELTDGLLRNTPADPKAFLLAKLKEKVSGEGKSTGAVKDENSDVTAETIAEIGGHHLIRLFESTRKITSEIVPKETINIVIQETLKLLRCDRVSLFIYDKKIDMLVLNASNLSTPIRVAPGQGISGHVFKTGNSVNIPDCYKDDRFDPGFDKKTGYHTKSLLTMPILDFEGVPCGVLQAINKENLGEFTQVDELILSHLNQHVGIALRNAEVYRDAIISSERATGLLYMAQSLSQGLGIQSVILTITMHANELVQAEHCMVFLVDEAKTQLWSISSDSGKEIRIPMKPGTGIAAECKCEGAPINITDAKKDPRFNPEVDKFSPDSDTQSVLAVPVYDNAKKRVLAVIQLINKKDFDGVVGTYNDEDMGIMETFAKFVGSKLESSNLVSEKKLKSEADSVFGSTPGHEGHKRHSMGHSMGGGIAEEDEEEQD